MARYVLRRLVAAPFLLLGIVTISFIVGRVVPADPVATVVSQRDLANRAIVHAAEVRFGLNQNVVAQYLKYLDDLVHGNLGISFTTQQSVTTDLSQRLPASIELMLAALVVAVIGGVAVGVLAAVRQNRLTDHIARLFALIGSSIPIYWAALILLLIFNVRLHWLPGPGRLDPTATPPPNITGFYTVDSLLAGQFSTFLDAVRHLILPAFCLAWGVIGILSRIIRASMLEVLAQDYIRTARSKGLREMVVLLRHALRNALIPAMTIVGLSAGFLITGAVLVEEIFSWPGVGSYAVTSSEALDFPAIQGVALLGGTIFILANLITDIGYGLADPRVRLA